MHVHYKQGQKPSYHHHQKPRTTPSTHSRPTNPQTFTLTLLPTPISLSQAEVTETFGKPGRLISALPSRGSLALKIGLVELEEGGEIALLQVADIIQDCICERKAC